MIGIRPAVIKKSLTYTALDFYFTRLMIFNQRKAQLFQLLLSNPEIILRTDEKQ
jgi:hypothetical protein